MVKRRGRRFANEAANYNAFGGAYHQLDASRFEYPNLPSYLLVAIAASYTAGVFIPPLIATQAFVAPARVGYLPVMMLNRVGLHTGLAA